MINRSEVLKALRSRIHPVDWDAVYESELSRIYNYFLYRVGNRELAQDLTATTFERAWKARRKYNAILASPSTWLFGISRNVLREHFRRNKSIESKIRPIQDSLPSPVDVEQSLQEQQDKARLRNFLLELPEREQDLVALKYGAGLTNREIARATGLSESNVGSILHRTVTNLRRKWEVCDER